jgi:sugar diacid utilization regulator
VEVQAIVDDLAQAVRHPLTLEDAGGRLVAYSVHEGPVDVVRMETLLRKGASAGTLEALRSRGVYEFVDSSQGLARVPPIPEIGFSSRVCLAIRGMDRILGYLWVAGGDSPLSKAAEEALLRTRRLLAQELMKRESALVVKQGQREELIADLCGKDQGDGDSLACRAKTLGWYAAAPLQVLVIRPSLSPAGPDEDRAIALLSGLDDVFGQYAPSALRGAYRGDVVAVVSGGEVRAAADLASAAAATPGEQNPPVAVGIGGTCGTLSHVRRSYLEASSAISLGARMRSGASCFDYGTLAPYELLSCLATCRKAGSYGRDAVERVIAYDDLHAGNLFETLEAFLDCYGRRKAAASRLNIHPNTLDYRIRRAGEIMGLDLDDPSARLVVHIWVKALSGQVRRGSRADGPGRAP